MATQRIQLNKDHGAHKAGAVISADKAALRASGLTPKDYTVLGTHPGPVPCELNPPGSSQPGQVTDRAIKSPPRK